MTLRKFFGFSLLGTLVLAIAGLISLTLPRGDYDPVSDGSMIALITRPQTYDGRIVVAVGVLALQVEHDPARLYLTQQDYDIGVLDNSIPVFLGDPDAPEGAALHAKGRELAGRYAWTKGRWRMFRQWNGRKMGILHIEEIMPYPIPVINLHDEIP